MWPPCEGGLEPSPLGPNGPNGPIFQAIRAIFGLFCSIATSLMVTLRIPLDWNIPTYWANHNQTIITKTPIH